MKLYNLKDNRKGNVVDIEGVEFLNVDGKYLRLDKLDSDEWVDEETYQETKTNDLTDYISDPDADFVYMRDLKDGHSQLVIRNMSRGEVFKLMLVTVSNFIGEDQEALQAFILTLMMNAVSNDEEGDE